MSRTSFRIALVFVVALLPGVASAQTGTTDRPRPRLVGRRRSPARPSGSSTRTTALDRRGGQRRAGRLSRRRAGAGPVPRGNARSTASRPRAPPRARSGSDRGARRDARPVAPHRRRGRHRAARSRKSRRRCRFRCRSSSGDADRERRRLQREPAEGADSDRPVLLDQPAQLGDQHPRPRRAVRAHQRRHRAGRRPLHRRRLLRASGRGDARLPRRRADRGAARPAGHALRQEHDRRRHQRHDAQADLHAGKPTSSSTTATSASFRRRPRSPARSLPKVAGRLSFSGTQRDGTVHNTSDARTT